MQKKIGIAMLACIVVSSLAGMGFNAYMNSRHNAELTSKGLPILAQKTAAASSAMQLRAQNFVGRYDQRETLKGAAQYMAKAAQEASTLTGKEADFPMQLRQLEIDFSTAYAMSEQVSYDLSRSYQRSSDEGIALCKVLNADHAASKTRTGNADAVIAADAVFAADALYADAVADLATLQEYYEDAAQGNGLDAVVSNHDAERVKALAARASAGRAGISAVLREANNAAPSVQAAAARTNELARTIGSCKYEAIWTIAPEAARSSSIGDYSTAAILYAMAGEMMDDVIAAGSDQPQEVKTWADRRSDYAAQARDSEARSDKAINRDIQDVLVPLVQAIAPHSY